MINWAAGEGMLPARVVDPGVGSGRFLSAAAERFPQAELIGVDVDPLATLMLRANATVNGFADRLRVCLLDYRQLELPDIDRPTLFIGNPPYVRHHGIDAKWKTWLALQAKRFGYTASKLSGLHIHFFFKTRELARPGDYGAFVTAAEWLDVDYGHALRRMLTDGLGGTAVHIIDSKARPFTDALTTGAITCFRVGARRSQITMRTVGSLSELAPLDGGRSVARDELVGARKWSVFTRQQPDTPAGFIELGELFRVHRGQVTGGNRVWIEGDATPEVPRRFKLPAVTSARELIAAGTELISAKELRRVIDLPPISPCWMLPSASSCNAFLHGQGAKAPMRATLRAIAARGGLWVCVNRRSSFAPIWRVEHRCSCAIEPRPATLTSRTGFIRGAH